MLGAPLPSARVARTVTYRVRVFQCPPKSRNLDMIQGLQARGELPPGARPIVISKFDVRARTADKACTMIRQGLHTRGYTVRSLGRSTGNEYLAYIVHPGDVEMDARKRRG